MAKVSRLTHSFMVIRAIFLYNITMASSSHFFMAAAPMRSNFTVWKALVMFALKGAHLSDFLQGKAEISAQNLVIDDKKKMHNPE
jgi:hypothetical protein